MSEHFKYFQDLVRNKKVLMAGPCWGKSTFGLVVLQTSSEEEAKEIMTNEPSVKGGVHTYEIQPMTVSLLVEYLSPARSVADPSDRVLRKEVVVSAPVKEVWEAWTTTEGTQTFFSSSTKVKLAVGGPFEIYFLLEAPEGSRGSEDCRILSFLPTEMLSFEWNAPPHFGDLRFKKTRVVLNLEEAGSNQTRVRFTQLGWGKGEEWEKLYDYFDRAWSYVLSNLQKRFTEGPIDWSK